MSKVHRTILPNGLRVVTIPLHDTQAVAVYVLTKVGSRYETRALSGVSHFIEHLMFKGTTKRPTTLDISKVLDGVGASYNAFTSKDCTGYYVKMNHEHTELALDVVSDMLQNSLFDPKEIERERGVIIEEIKMYDENPIMAIEDLFESTVFGTHHPLGWNIAGPKSVIASVKRRDIIRYRDTYYHAGNMWVVVAGKLSPNIHKLIKRYFASVVKRPRTPAFRRYVTSAMPQVVQRTKDLEQVQLGLGMRSYAYTDRRLAALQVLSVILGGNMSARLFVEVREKRGLAYSVSSSPNPYEDSGCFMIHAGLERSRLHEALSVIVGELTKLKTTPVSTAELQQAKEFIRGKTILGLEDSDSLASWYGRQSLFQPHLASPEEALARISKVTAAQIQAVARELFRPEAMHLALVGPKQDAKKLRSIIRRV